MAKDHNNIIRFQAPQHYDLAQTCHAHGWLNLEPFQWIADSKQIKFAVVIDRVPIDVIASQSNSLVKVQLNCAGSALPSDSDTLKNQIIRVLGLDHDTLLLLQKAEKINEDAAKLVRCGAGRLLRSPTLWEDAAKTLFTTNCSWALTKKICSAFCSSLFGSPTPNGLFAFPDPQTILNFSENDLRQLTPVGYRASYLISLAEQFTNNPVFIDFESQRYDFKEAYQIVQSLKGFGAYATSHFLIMAGYYNKIPVDTVVTSFIKQNYRVRKIESFINRKYGTWKEYKWWGLKLDKMLRRQNWLGD